MYICIMYILYNVYIYIYICIYIYTYMCANKVDNKDMIQNIYIYIYLYIYIYIIRILIWCVLVVYTNSCFTPMMNYGKFMKIPYRMGDQ